MRLVVIDDDKTVHEIKDVIGYWYWTRAEIAEVLEHFTEGEGREELEELSLTFDELVDLTVDYVSTMDNCPDGDSIIDIVYDPILSNIKYEREQEESEESD